MKQTIRKTFITGAAFALLVSPTAVLARDGLSGGSDSEVHAEMESPSPSVSPSKTPRPERQRAFETELRDQLEKKSQERQSDVKVSKTEKQEKLSDAKKKACENHITTISNLKTVMDKRRTNTITRISKIADAVQAFKVKKNLDVTNYDELVAKVNAAKAVAESAAQAQQQIPSLDCSGDHPRADVADFKEKRAASIDAVKAYRDAVKALVGAVKTAAGSTETSQSPSPSTTPEGGNQ